MIDYLGSQQNMKTALASLADRIDSAIVTSPYFADDRLKVRAGEDCVVVEGTVESYFHKQMAQETLLRVDGVRRIDNRLQVTSALH